MTERLRKILAVLIATLLVTGSQPIRAEDAEVDPDPIIIVDPEPDADGDGIHDANDNCVNVPNPGQQDSDADGVGDVCDPTPLPDADGDGVTDPSDNCPNAPNGDQLDSDADGAGDVCDPTPFPPPPDADADGVPDANDNCPQVPNTNQLDSDSDSVGDACDPTPLPDADGDGVSDGADNCPQVSNTNQQDSDQDGTGDVCDATPLPDADHDGVPDAQDNCAAAPNADQQDSDHDGAGDVCDATPLPDADHDGVADSIDNCPSAANPDQQDSDHDGLGDACDPTPLPDQDADGVNDAADNCPSTSNPGQLDSDADGLGDVCDATPLPDADHDGVSDGADNCPAHANTDQQDSDSDGLGDVCDETPLPDRDGDGVTDASDNCPDHFNGDQLDSDNDGVGDECDPTPFPAPTPTDPRTILEEANITFTLDDHGKLATELKKFFVWAGIGYDENALSSALKDLGGICLKDRRSDEVRQEREEAAQEQEEIAKEAEKKADDQEKTAEAQEKKAQQQREKADKAKEKGQKKADEEEAKALEEEAAAAEERAKAEELRAEADEERAKATELWAHVDDPVEGDTAEAHELDLLPLVNASWQGGIQELKLTLNCHSSAADQAVMIMAYLQPVMIGADNSVVLLPVDVSVDPKKLNLSSDRQFVTMHLELPEGYDPARISRLTVRITEIDGRPVVPSLRGSPQAFGFEDSDGDGVNELMLKFRFNRLKPHLTANDVNRVTVKGFLDTGEAFSTEYTQIVRYKRNGRRASDKKGRAQVKLPAGAHRTQLDLTVTENNAPEPARDEKAEEAKIKAAGPGFEFGPHGTVFERPVEITLAYDPASLGDAKEDDLCVHYWNDVSRLWEKLESRVNKQARTVSASVKHFSFYQVMAPAPAAAPAPELPAATGTGDAGTTGGGAPADPGFGLGEVYAFPNPSRGGVATLHVETGRADAVEVRIYNVAGELVHETTLSGEPALVNGVPAYEYAWDTSSVAPGLYIYQVRARRQGHGDAKISGKLAVLR